MAARANLRTVKPGDAPVETEAPVKTKAKSVTQAAQKGTTRELLAAMRDRIAAAVEDRYTPARDLAALTKRLMETVREIEAIDAREVESGGGADAAKVEDGEFDASAV